VAFFADNMAAFRKVNIFGDLPRFFQTLHDIIHFPVNLAISSHASLKTRIKVNRPFCQASVLGVLLFRMQ
jgi:hypothetical protein